MTVRVVWRCVAVEYARERLPDWLFASEEEKAKQHCVAIKTRSGPKLKRCVVS